MSEQKQSNKARLHCSYCEQVTEHDIDQENTDGLDIEATCTVCEGYSLYKSIYP